MSFVIPFAFSSVYSVNTFLQAAGKLCILYCSGESKSCAMEIFSASVGKAHKYSLHKLFALGNSLLKNVSGLNYVIQIA